MVYKVLSKFKLVCIALSSFPLWHFLGRVSTEWGVTFKVIFTDSCHPLHCVDQGFRRFRTQWHQCGKAISLVSVQNFMASGVLTFWNVFLGPWFPSLLLFMCHISVAKYLLISSPWFLCWEPSTHTCEHSTTELWFRLPGSLSIFGLPVGSGSVDSLFLTTRLKV